MAFNIIMVAILSFCIFNPSSGVAGQGNAPAPSPVLAPANAPGPSGAQDPVILYNFTWSREEQNALKDIIQEWSKTNTDIDSLLVGWSETELNPCQAVWEGIVCTYDILNITYNANGTETVSANLSVVGLSITDTDLIGVLPPAIGNLSNLVYIIITGNPGLSGPIPKELSGLTNLQILDLHDNNFYGELPMEMGSIENLNIMDLSQNNLSGPIPSTLSNLTYLTLLQLFRNNFNGIIPGSNNDGLGLGNLSYLESLGLMENNLTGGLPNFGNIPGLQYVNVSHNQLSGSITLEKHFNVSAQRPLRSLDLSFNSFTGPIPNLAILNDTLQQLYLSYNQFNSTEVPEWLSNFNVLKTLGLANISLTGTVPTFLFNELPNLTLLQLENNSFDGELDLSSINVRSTSLTLVNLTANYITEVAYSEIMLESPTIRFLLEDNPFCNAMKSQNLTLEKYFFCRNSTTPVIVISGIDRYRTAIISASVTVSVAFLLVAVLAIFFCWKSRRERKLYYVQIQEEFARKHVQPTLYAYSELRSATRDFHPDMKLGQGAFGVVYKGVQADGTELAVKDLTGQTQQGLDEFLNEVVLITGVRHRNLVKLKGCCLKDDRRLLVYEYVENNNLAEVLFEGVGGHDLNWAVRYNMCLGVAQGLLYLHESAQPRIIHRDIKAPNILLDNKLNPKIADFGLARLFPDEESHITTLHVAGTMGYMAPEYASRGQLTEKADVFSFGVVVLEIVSGRRNIEPKLAVEDIYLLELAWRLHDEGTLLEIVDPTMNITGYEEEVERALQVALLCVQSIGQRRPSMARVVSMLKGEVEIEVVFRQLQFSRPEYNSFLAAAQSGSNFTMTTIPEKEEIVEDDKPLLIASASSASTRSSSIVELSTLRPR